MAGLTSEQQIERRKRQGTTSQWWGVTWHKYRRKWMARITDLDHKNKFLGLFDDDREAAKAYLVEAKKIWGPNVRFDDQVALGLATI